MRRKDTSRQFRFAQAARIVNALFPIVLSVALKLIATHFDWR
jgi:hypothetical protein